MSLTTLYANSTNTLFYTPLVDGSAPDDEPNSVSVAVTYDSSAITIAATPSWDASNNRWALTITHTEVLAAHDGQTWEIAWTWSDDGTVILRDVETAIVTERVPGIPTLTTATNTYVTLAQAETFFNERLNASDWTDAAEIDKARALIQATHNLERLAYIGRQYVSTQTLKWPRSDLYATRAAVIVGGSYEYDISGGSVPQAVKDAQCEEAISLLGQSGSTRADLQAQGVTSYTIGGLSETFSGTGSRRFVSPEAAALLAGYIAGAVPIR